LLQDEVLLVVCRLSFDGRMKIVVHTVSYILSVGMSCVGTRSTHGKISEGLSQVRKQHWRKLSSISEPLRSAESTLRSHCQQHIKQFQVQQEHASCM